MNGGKRELVFFIVSIFLSYFLMTSPAHAAEPFKFSSSTQYLWGDDVLGEHQYILGQYLRFNYAPEGQNLSITGYGRVWKDFAGDSIRDNDINGRLYYLFMEFSPLKDVAVRLGRQFVAFTAEKAIMDGARIDVHNLGPIGITAAVGRDVLFTLDGEHSRFGNYFYGFDVHLERVKSLQLGVSYAAKYDTSDLARQELGANFRYTYKYVSPFADVRYDLLTRSVNEANVGVDIFPMTNLLVKAEYYYALPTFNATDIFSVFAVDKYQEYTVRAEYSLDALPLIPYIEYAKQTYQDNDHADRYALGVKVIPIKNLLINAAVDYRHGFGGNLWGFEFNVDYKIKNKIIVSAGLQYDTYRRPDQIDLGLGDNIARRYWVGADWLIDKRLSLLARIEDNVNESFKHRPLGRVALNWNL